MYFKINILLFSFSCIDFSLSDNPKLLIISFDGFPIRFFNKSLTPNLWKFAQKGVSFEYGTSPQYIVHSWPNHMSVSTGLYVESHGIIGDFFHDYEVDETFDNRRLSRNQSFYRDSLKSHWYKGEPIWLTNQRAGNGRSSGSMFWPMAEAKIDGEYPDKFKPPHAEDRDDHNLDQAKRNFDTLLSWFTHRNNSVNLGLFYNSFLDRPDTLNRTKDILHEVDSLVKHIMERLEHEHLWDTINVIILSDRGISDIAKDDPNDRNICNFIDCDRILVNVDSILPKEFTNMTEIHEQLLSINNQSEKLKIDVFWKPEFPTKYHYDNPLVGPIILTGVYPHWFNLPQVGFKIHHNSPAPSFVPEVQSQRGILLMHGPAFENGITMDRKDVQNIDIYPLMCKILGIEAAANNASLARVEMCLLSVQKGYADYVLIIFGAIALVVIVSCLIYCICWRCKRTGYEAM